MAATRDALLAPSVRWNPPGLQRARTTTKATGCTDVVQRGVARLKSFSADCTKSVGTSAMFDANKNWSRHTDDDGVVASTR